MQNTRTTRVKREFYFPYDLKPLTGTGSNPPRQKGLHLKTLHTDKTKPAKKPRFSNASIA